MIDKTYKDWLKSLKGKIRTAQLKAAVAVNTELIMLYWDLGKMISEKQTAWGTKFIEQLSKDLKEEFPDLQGFSETNLKYCKLFYAYFAIRPQVEDELNLSPRAGDEIPFVELTKVPWGHIKVIITGEKNIDKAKFYINQSIENGWSRNILELQIKSDLYSRQGKAINNFKNTLPAADSDLAAQLLKDPYNFDFFTITQNYINHPIGISEYQLTKLFPEEFKSSLPTIEEIENQLKDEQQL